MTDDFDMSQYLNIFLDEAQEELQELDSGFLELEKEGVNDELLNRIFRAAHTLKGSSASMGFEQMAQLTHMLESVLDRIRRRELRVEQELIDLFLLSSDKLRKMLEEIASGQDVTVEVADLVESLRKFLEIEIEKVEIDKEEKDKEAKTGEEVSITLEDAEESVARTALASGYNVYYIKVVLDKNVLMKAARAYLVFKNLEDLGEVIKTIPPTEDIEKEQFDRVFEIVIISKNNADTILKAINSISEIANVEVKPLQLTVAKEEEVSSVPLSEKEAKEREAEIQAEAKKVLSRKNSVLTQTVRVDVERLENLMNLVGELVIDKTRLDMVSSQIEEELKKTAVSDDLEELTTHIGRVTSQLQEEIMKARMFPLEQVFNRFPRMVRDLAQAFGKKVNFVIEGQETELDRTVIEEISDPLIHLLRNAIDHGLETPAERKALAKPEEGTVLLKAFAQENHIVIIVQDDGRGMEVEKIKARAVEKGVITADAAARLSEREALNLIFLPGFSTSEMVNEVSGRGVGMDIVRAHLERINGSVDIKTTPGKGTKFTLRLPLTLVINRAMMVKGDDHVRAISLSSVIEIANFKKSEIKLVYNKPVVVLREEVIPLLNLEDLLYLRPQREFSENLPTVIVGIEEEKIGLVVDDILGEQEIVIKSLGDYLGQISGLSGATILGDGSVALIVDIRSLLRNAEVSY